MTQSAPPVGRIQRIVGVVLAFTGFGLALPGLYLAGLGGSIYYLVAGAGLIVAGVLAWRGRHAADWIVYAIALATLAWSLWEVGFDGWALLPRIDLIAALVLLTAAARWWNRRPSAKMSKAILRTAAATGCAILLLAIGGRLLVELRSPDALAAAPMMAVDSQAASDWPSIRGGEAADLYSPLTAIHPGNVAQLKVAWTARLGMPTAGRLIALEATPVKVGDTLYTCNGDNAAVAIDAETGKQRWIFDPLISASIPVVRCRGVTYYSVPQATGFCSTRIALQTVDARLFALDAATGHRCPSFGRKGVVDLTEGMGIVHQGYLEITSPAQLVRGKLVIGGVILDSQSIDEPSGVIRAFDMVSGQLAWAWDMGRPGQYGMPAAGTTFTRGTPNAWPPMSADEALGLVYVPLGNATPDWTSSHRTPEMHKYGSSLVALDANTGAPRWHFQTTHRDVWDYDNPSPPTLFDFPTQAGPVPAVVQPTKRGQLFVLDRRTGRPLVETVERPVPQGAVPGETLAPTQPYSVGMPDLSGGRLTEARMWGITPFDQLWCRIRFKDAHYRGEFTPLSTDRATVVFPGYIGGSSWGGVSIDRARQVMIANINYFPTYNWLVKRADADPKLYKVYSGGLPNNTHWPQQGTNYATTTQPFMSPLGIPCLQPPYAEIAAIDLKTRRLLWRRPLGTARDSGPLGIASRLPIPMGVPAMGGALVTASGLVFIGATQERSIRAIDIRNGQILWSARLPAGANANPMSYRSARTGRQYLIVAAGGHPYLMNGAGDHLIAFALPARRRR